MDSEESNTLVINLDSSSDSDSKQDVIVPARRAVSSNAAAAPSNAAAAPSNAAAAPAAQPIASSSNRSSNMQFITWRNGVMIVNLDAPISDSELDDSVPANAAPVVHAEPTPQISNIRTLAAPSASERTDAAIAPLGDDTTGELRGATQSKKSDDKFRKRIKVKKIAKNRKRDRKRMKVSDDTQRSADRAVDDGGESSRQKAEHHDSDKSMDYLSTDDIHTQVIDLLNNGTERDLLELPTMKEKNVEAIVSNRPFLSWLEAEFKFSHVKGLRTSLLESVCKMFVAKNVVKEVLRKCEYLAARIEKKVASVGTFVSKSPDLLEPALKLTNYQLLGLNWLALMRSESLNSILADEMGLGKTIQTIAFLAYLKENNLAVAGRPHLIVVPSSTLNNWTNEFAKWCPHLKVVQYYGDKNDRLQMRHNWFQEEGFGDTDVILTTYTCAAHVHEEKKMFKIKKFNYVVFDEAHMLKNMNTERYRALIKFNGKYKLLLTGTPLQNNLLELMSLLNFLMPNLFEGIMDHVKLLFSKYSKAIDDDSSDYEKNQVEQAKRIIEPFMLRRTKEAVLSDLPPKTVTVTKCPLTNDQRVKYNELADQFKAESNVAGSSCHMSYYVKLRKITNHPLLLRYHFTEDMLREMAVCLASDINYTGTNADHISEDLYFKSDYELHRMCQDTFSLWGLNYKIEDDFFLQSGKLQTLAPMLQSFKESGDRVLIFSQFIHMLDILQEFCRIKEYPYLRFDGSTQTAVRQELIDLFNSSPDIFIFLLTTKAGGLGINLTSANIVIIHDIDFNPYNDKQAEDRSHRIGQTKPVQVFRLIGENTVEEEIQTAATKKLSLEKEVTSGCDSDEKNVETVIELLKNSLGLSVGADEQ